MAMHPKVLGFTLDPKLMYSTHIHNISVQAHKPLHMSACSVDGFKSQLDSYLRNIVDLPCPPGFNNSLYGGDCLHGGYCADELTAN